MGLPNCSQALKIFTKGLLIFYKASKIIMGHDNIPRPLEVFILWIVQYTLFYKYNNKFRLVTAMHSNGPLPQV